jgi:transposase
VVADLARDERADITRLTQAIHALAKRIGDRVRTVARGLLALPGCAELTAAKLVGLAAGVSRFKSEAAFARHAHRIPFAA